MNQNNIEYKHTRNLSIDDILILYQANNWSSAKKPNELYNALMNSHSLISAWNQEKLVGLINSITDGYLVVYYPHLLVLPEYQKQGIGLNLLKIITQKYQDFHQQILVAEAETVGFYYKCGFRKAGDTQAMWIYHGEN
ncbi:acetyltransferase (GNAT) family protein [Rivularia sp. PCC 7116]|uniref:GNAT family N-acetyltransferase n=1 Tax=Rivularia sp. PCC 7116 TaxID=373994 RepID=UPI00029F1568|nr:GNAT family N-acetyltransferase [Rivularia sp. PCC 7116]AFY53698.1 acetyltransferase (GNAT) family protein [Rivularia sp. PCC 7116]